MEMSTWLHPTWAILFPILASVPLGWFMAKALDVPADREGRGFRRLTEQRPGQQQAKRKKNASH